MATQLLMKRQGKGLVPADPVAAELMAKLPMGKVLKGTISQPRNPDHHRKFFALLGAVFPHQDTYATNESFLSAIKCALGYGESVKLLDGRTVLVPGSISFAKMDQQANRAR